MEINLDIVNVIIYEHVNCFYKILCIMGYIKIIKQNKILSIVGY
jgi:hypothetical protein